jgi:S1-C subfamily serine protease
VLVDFELERKGAHYEVARVAPDSTLSLNGAPLRVGAIIKDADEVRADESDFRLRFFPVGLNNAIVTTGANRRADFQVLSGENVSASAGVQVAPFIEHAAIEAAATARRDDAKVFLREFTRELVREISPLTKILSLLIVATLISGAVFFFHRLNKESQRVRAENEALTRRLAEISEKVGATTSQISQLDQSNQAIIGTLSIAPNIVAKYSAGVCLIAGTYQWYDTRTNRPLRYSRPVVEEDGETPTDPGEDGATLSPDGNGAIAQFDFVGTGFHVGGGYVMTNRHVAARPWEADPRSQMLTGTVPARARVVRLLAFFPNRPKALTLRLRVASQNEDLAVGTVEPELVADVPVLPLDSDTNNTETGNDVVMIGFPSGPDRLLALLPEAQSRSAQVRFGDSLEGLIGYLATQNLIRPLTTRGTITDLPPRRIVYDARTAEGGSGAPLFGQSGQVIGVNFAVLSSNSASNFAVPVRFARELLARTGWQASTPVAAANRNPTSGDNTTTANAAEDSRNSNTNSSVAR